VADKKVANSLLALSSAAVLAVYAAGYERTRAAATRFDVQAEDRRLASPKPPGEGGHASVPQPVVTAPPAPEGEDKPRPAVTAKAIRKPKRAIQVAAPAVPDPAPPPPVVEPPAPVIAAPQEPPPAPPPPAKPVYKDGTYLGWGTSRHGDIQAQVVIEDGRIKAATIAQCLTRYSCNVISNLPPQVAQRQSPETDYVSGATQSTNAFYYAVVDALSKAK
jgi:uncharacterized protein with FMN-binding domain